MEAKIEKEENKEDLAKGKGKKKKEEKFTKSRKQTTSQNNGN
jgi:hypothetical protein